MKKNPNPIDSGTHLIVEYAGVFARHIVTVTIACKAHIHISSCQSGGQNRLSSFQKKNNPKKQQQKTTPVRQQRTTDRIKLQLAKQQGSNCLCPSSQDCMNNAAISHRTKFQWGKGRLAAPRRLKSISQLLGLSRRI